MTCRIFLATQARQTIASDTERIGLQANYTSASLVN